MRRQTIKDLDAIVEYLTEYNIAVWPSKYIEGRNMDEDYCNYLFDIIIATTHNKMPIVKCAKSVKKISATHNLEEFWSSGSFSSLNRRNAIKTIAKYSIIISGSIGGIAAFIYYLIQILNLCKK